MSAAHLTKNFGKLAIPAELTKLVEFEEGLDEMDFYAQGFEIAHFKKDGLKTYSKRKPFLNSFVEFAQADGTGSVYALWLKASVGQPVVVFGSEGGYHIIAKDLQSLFHILTYDTESMVDWDGVSYEGEGEEPSRHHDAFKAWVTETFGANDAANADAIVTAAQEELGEEFGEWMAQYHDKE